MLSNKTKEQDEAVKPCLETDGNVLLPMATGAGKANSNWICYG